MTAGPRSSALSLAVVALLAAAAGVFSFTVARSLRTSPVQAGVVRVSATSAAYGPAKAAAYRAAYTSGYGQGRRAGMAAGRRDGRRAGTAAGRRAAASRRAAEARQAVALRSFERIQAVATAGVPRTAARKTQPCVEVGDGLCEVVGPAVTGRPCPPRSTPAPGRVVCAPQLLGIAAAAVPR